MKLGGGGGHKRRRNSRRESPCVALSRPVLCQSEVGMRFLTLNMDQEALAVRRYIVSRAFHVDFWPHREKGLHLQHLERPAPTVNERRHHRESLLRTRGQEEDSTSAG